MKNKLLWIVGGSLFVVGCSGTPKLSGFEGPQAYDRLDVVKGNKDCVDAGMRPNVEYVVKKTDSGKVLVPINVHCEPYYEKGFLGYPEKKK
jgi:hypothetical protein